MLSFTNPDKEAGSAKFAQQEIKKPAMGNRRTESLSQRVAVKKEVAWLKPEFLTADFSSDGTTDTVFALTVQEKRIRKGEATGMDRGGKQQAC